MSIVETPKLNNALHIQALTFGSHADESERYPLRHVNADHLFIPSDPVKRNAVSI